MLGLHRCRSVEPEQVDLVVFHQFLDLRIRFLGEVFVHGFIVRFVVGGKLGVDFSDGFRRGERRARLAPIEGLRVVNAELQPVAVAGLLEFLDDVAPEWRAIDDIVIRDARLEEREAIVVLRGDDDILHAGFLENPRPLVGIELLRVEFGNNLLAVFLKGNAIGHHRPLGVGWAVGVTFVLTSQGRIRAEVDEDPEFIIAEPLVQPRLGLRRMAQVGGKPLFERVRVGLLRVVRTRHGLGKGKSAEER